MVIIPLEEEIEVQKDRNMNDRIILMKIVVDFMSKKERKIDFVIEIVQNFLLDVNIQIKIFKKKEDIQEKIHLFPIVS